MGQAIPLAPVYISKPWGREIWYTGMENRGVSLVGAIGGTSTPLPWVQAALPHEVLGERTRPLVLLKILDPGPEPVVGDLYFELHEEKREAYIVTYIDPAAWPDGTGYIRMGFNPQKRSQYPGDVEFKEAYLLATRKYEEVRKLIDSTDQSQALQSADEEHLRSEMESFTAMRPVRVGDVLKVPLLTPHSLQHGVRTIEFQTPVYERMVLSFGQKLPSQDHWDINEAVSRMSLDAPLVDEFEILQDEPGLLVEKIVDFTDFEVFRVCSESGGQPACINISDYALIIVVTGYLKAGDAIYGPEQALILPRKWSLFLGAADPVEPLVFLLATPCNRAVES